MFDDIVYVIYRVIQEERSILWEVIVSAKKVRMNMCLILNVYGDIAVEVKHYKTFSLAF
jgi:hypothetical protein